MSFPDPGTLDLNATDGSSWPTYPLGGLSNRSAHSATRLSHSGLWEAVEAEAPRAGAPLAAPPEIMDAVATARVKEAPMATSADRFNRLSFQSIRGTWGWPGDPRGSDTSIKVVGGRPDPR